ncbi:uncharacterized protein LOC113460237 isoform X2 [Zonotrichia albicollis]|uniref:uncharacterized protein LOC113460237 isoform X2 n=1 Tax=Zonotrichia albicollis TaxID=44394 RepID=UPI003D80FB96
MWPCLLLALALLGTVPASHHAVPAAPRQPQEVPAGDTTQPYYAVVKKLCTYSGAQRYCQDVYRGRLASVHSAARNQELQKLAQTYHIIISPWIGAVTSRRMGSGEAASASSCVLSSASTEHPALPRQPSSFPSKAEKP